MLLYLMLIFVFKQRHVFLWVMAFSFELFRFLELLTFTSSFVSLLKINWFKYVLNTSWYLQRNTLKQTCKHGRYYMNHHPKGWVFGHLVGNGSGCWKLKEMVWETWWIQECFLGTLPAHMLVFTFNTEHPTEKEYAVMRNICCVSTTLFYIIQFMCQCN